MHHGYTIITKDTHNTSHRTYGIPIFALEHGFMIRKINMIRNTSF